MFGGVAGDAAVEGGDFFLVVFDENRLADADDGFVARFEIAGQFVFDDAVFDTLSPFWRECRAISAWPEKSFLSCLLSFSANPASA
ncbi:MAG: hypothetical protein LBB76_06800 [Azoarcus sp.]|nr:hypothetical protein [Azoarcus sp.]